MRSTLTQLTVPNDFIERFDELAQATGLRREDVMLAALEAYLAQIAAEDARIEEARLAVARGERVDAEEIHAEDEAFLADLGLPQEQLAAIAAAVEREAEAAYDVSL